MNGVPQNQQIINLIDEWLEQNHWRLEQHTLDFALDVRNLAAGAETELDLKSAA